VKFQSEAFYDSTGQDFSFFDARGFFANSTNADAQEDVALKHIESASDRIADPIGFLSARENPQRAADRILEQYRSGTDVALVLVSRLTGINP
jgi:hypothetical protein